MEVLSLNTDALTYFDDGVLSADLGVDDDDVEVDFTFADFDTVALRTAARGCRQSRCMCPTLPQL